MEADRDLRATADRDQIQQALLNLLLNAIDATSVGGEVVVRATNGLDRKVELQVENPGDPIPEEVLSQMFEPFYTTKPQGTGLGLAITRNIAKAHGGEAWVRKNEDGRVCFAMTISANDAIFNGSSY